MDKNMSGTLITNDQTRNPEPQPLMLSQSQASRPARHSKISHMSRATSSTNSRKLVIEEQGMNYGDFLVFCPVCRREYKHSDMPYHAAVHDGSHNYNFATATQNNQMVDPSFGVAMYPMIEPLEFYTDELSHSAHSDQFILQRNQNYDRVDKGLFKEMRQASVQTLNKPPLQYEATRTNWYNCMDNAVNKGKGPSFSASDICGNNDGIAPQRELNEWEHMRINPSQRTIVSRSRH